MVKKLPHLIISFFLCVSDVVAEPLKISPLPSTLTDVTKLSLSDAETIFHMGNRDLKLAELAVEGAKSDAITAGQRPNPTLQVSSYSLNGVTWHSSNRWEQKTYDTIVNLNQLIERGNKLGLRKEMAQFNITAAKEDLQDVLRSQRIVLISAYYDLLLAQEKLRITSETSALYQKTLEATQRRQKAGDVSASDVARIRVDVLRAENDMRLARADVEKGRMALAYLLGIEQKAKDINATDPWPDLQAPAQENPETLLDRRADVRAAKARLAAADKSRALAYAMRTRDISVGVQYEHFPNQPNNNTFGLDVNFPLFVNSYFEGQIGRANADWLAAEKNMERVKALAMQEISRIQSDLSAAEERFRRFQKDLLAAAKKAADAAEFAYQHGAMGVLDLLDARRTLYATRLDSANTTSDYAKTLAAWKIYTSAEQPEQRP